ncbi:MAG: DUF4340 domain-containing protein [Verrucomicrobia bacterium]|nr:DUF4340 domain-containing protein [Verrucomicrobiota bacterium]
MNPRTTWGLLAAALLLFAYILVFERGRESPSDALDRAAKLFPDFDPARVTTVGIRRTNAFVSAERLNDRWQLINPAYPAQATAIEELLKSIASLQAQTRISAKEISSQPGGRADFGLQPPAAAITVGSGTNRISFEIGAKTFLGDQVYLQLAGDSRIFVTEGRILDYLPSSTNAWRNPLLIHDDRLMIDRIAVTNETSFFVLVRDATNQSWRLDVPLAARADANTVDYLVQQLRGARVSGFITDDPAADLEAYGLQGPKVQLTLARGTNPVFQAQFGLSPTNNPDLVYARRLSHTNVVLLPKDLVDLLRKSHEFFRDRNLVSFAESAVGRVEILSKGEVCALQRQTNGAWQIVEPFKADADFETVRELFANLARLEILDFERDIVTDFTQFGLAPPVRRYLLTAPLTNAPGATNLTLAKVDFGTNRVDKVFVRRADEPSVYTVSLGDALRLPQSAFEFRDRRIWNFAASNVVSLTVVQRGRTRKLERNAQRKWHTEIVEHEAVEETLQRLGHLRAVSWRGKGDDQIWLKQFSEVDYQIALDVRDKGTLRTHTVRFGQAFRDGHRYAMVQLEEGQWVIFLFPGPLFQDVARVLSIPEVLGP